MGACIPLKQLVAAADTLLRPARFRDYCPNGLQVEGRGEVRHLVSGVTASMDFIKAAIAAEADALLVHHGYFWKGEDAAISGMKRSRIAALLQAELSLLAYHLPLDAHPEYGNNVQLGRVLGLEHTGSLEPENPEGIGCTGRLPQPMPAGDFAELVEQRLQRKPLHIGNPAGTIKTIAWCTGAAQSFIEQAIHAGVDAYLSGEVSEQTVHAARESGVHFFAAGHHATERYGPQATGEYLANSLGIAHTFIDIDNPA